jgi:hypothetical protein
MREAACWGSDDDGCREAAPERGLGCLTDRESEIVYGSCERGDRVVLGQGMQFYGPALAHSHLGAEADTVVTHDVLTISPPLAI